MSLQILNVALNHSVLGINSCNQPFDRYVVNHQNYQHHPLAISQPIVPAYIFQLDHVNKLSSSDKLTKRRKQVTNKWQTTTGKRERRKKRSRYTGTSSFEEKASKRNKMITTNKNNVQCPTKLNGLDKYCCGDEQVRYCCILPATAKFASKNEEESIVKLSRSPRSLSHSNLVDINGDTNKNAPPTNEPNDSFKLQNATTLSSDNSSNVERTREDNNQTNSHSQDPPEPPTTITNFNITGPPTSTVFHEELPKLNLDSSSSSVVDDDDDDEVKKQSTDSKSNEMNQMVEHRSAGETQHQDNEDSTKANETILATSSEASIDNFSETMDIISSDEIISSAALVPTSNRGNNNHDRQTYLDKSSNVISIHPRMIIRLIGISMLAAMFMTIITCFICKRYLKCKNSSCCCCCCLRDNNNNNNQSDNNDINDTSDTTMTHQHPDHDGPLLTSVGYQHIEQPAAVNAGYWYRSSGTPVTSSHNPSGGRRRDSYGVCPYYQLIFNRNNSQRPPPLYSSTVNCSQLSSDSLDDNSQLLMPEFINNNNNNPHQSLEINGGVYILNNGNQATNQHQQSSMMNHYNHGQADTQANYSVIMDNLELTHMYDQSQSTMGQQYDDNYNNQTNLQLSPSYATTNEHHQYAICEQQPQQQTTQSGTNINILSSSSALSKAKLLSAEDLLNLSKITEIPIIIAASNEPPQVIMSKFNRLQQQQQQLCYRNTNTSVEEPSFCLLAPSNFQQQQQQQQQQPPATTTTLTQHQQPVGRHMEATNYSETFNSDNGRQLVRVAPILDPPPPYTDHSMETRGPQNGTSSSKLFQISLVNSCQSANSASDSGTDDSGTSVGNREANIITTGSNTTGLSIPPAISSDSGMASGDDTSSFAGHADCTGPEALDCSCSCSIASSGENKKESKT